MNATGRASKGRNYDSSNSKKNHCIKQERRKIVARLQHNPYRNKRSHGNVKGNNYNPSYASAAKTNIQSKNYNSDNCNNSADCRRKSFYAKAVCNKSVDYSKNNKADRNHCSRLVFRRIKNKKTCFFYSVSNLLSSKSRSKESACYDIYKRSNYKNQNEKRKNNEQFLRKFAHRRSDNFANRLSFVTD